MHRSWQQRHWRHGCLFAAQLRYHHLLMSTMLQLLCQLPVVTAGAAVGICCGCLVGWKSQHSAAAKGTQAQFLLLQHVSLGKLEMGRVY